MSGTLGDAVGKDTMEQLRARANGNGPNGGNGAHSSPLELADLDAIEKKATKAEEDKAKIRPWMMSLLQKLEKAIASGNHEAEVEYRRLLKDRLNDPDVSRRRAAITAYFLYFFSKPLSREESRRVLEDMASRRLLLEATGGCFKAGGTAYDFSPSASLLDEEKTEVKTAWTKMVEAREEGVLKELHDQANLTWDDLIGKKPGKYLAEVPPEKVEPETGPSYWRGGGAMLVESDGTKISPLGATRSIAEAISDAMGLKVHLLVDSLNWNQAPFIKGLPREQGAKVRLLWHLLQRARRAEEEKEQLQTVRQEFAGRTTVTAREFFLEQKPGVALVEYQGYWKVPEGGNIPHPFFLIERKAGEEGTTLQVLDISPHLGNLFADCSEEYVEGERFEGVPQPLRAILQAAYGQVEKSDRVEPK